MNSILIQLACQEEEKTKKLYDSYVNFFLKEEISLFSKNLTKNVLEKNLNETIKNIVLENVNISVNEEIKNYDKKIKEQLLQNRKIIKTIVKQKWTNFINDEVENIHEKNYSKLYFKYQHKKKMLNSYINNQAKIMETIEERLLFLEKESKEDKNQIQELILNKEDNQINKEKKQEIY